MDPQACLEAMLEALAFEQFEDASERFQDIAEWINRGGFVPDLAKAIRKVTSND